ncbi:MAG: hypothetical protein ACREK9_09185 [Candidatus Rokuibacteriota bacterium]
MSETEMLALGEALARTMNVLRPGERIPFRDYLRRVLRDSEDQIAALSGESAFIVSVDGQPVEGPDSERSVAPGSRVVLYRRQGPMLDVLTRGVVRRICLD